MKNRRFANLFRSVLHNIGVTAVGFAFAFLGRSLDFLLGLDVFKSPFASAAAWLFLIAGFLLRGWAMLHFYERQMKVISLVPQKSLITSGPYRFSRNPLYLGGNVFIFFGAALFLGSTMGLFSPLSISSSSMFGSDVKKNNLKMTSVRNGFVTGIASVDGCSLDPDKK